MRLSRGQSGFGATAVVLIIAVLLVAGLGGYLVMNKDKATEPSGNSQTTQDTSQTDGLIATSIVSSAEISTTNPTNTVTFTHPKDWEVSKKTETKTGNTKATTTAYIHSAKGNYLYVYDRSSVGGSCEQNSEKYTLVKRIKTAEHERVFSEYNTANNNRNLYLEFVEDNTLRSGMQEGDTFENTCDIANNYGFTGAGDLVVTITKDPTDNKSVQDRVPYSELAQDTEFIEMLKTLTLSK